MKVENIIRALRIIWFASPKWTILSGFVVLLKGIMPLLLIVVVQLVVDEVSMMISDQSAVSDLNKVYQILFFMGGVFLLNAFLNSIAGVISEKHSFYINDKIQNLIHQRTTQIDFVNFDDYHFQNIYFRAVNESTYRPSRIYYGFIDLIQSAITLGLMMGVLFTLHPLIILLLIIVSIPVIFTRLNFSKKIYNVKKEHTEDERNVGYYNKLLTAKEFAKELRVFDLSDLFKQRFETTKESLRQRQFALVMLKSKYEFGVQVLTASTLIFIFGYIAKQAIEGAITQGVMVLCLLALYRGHSFLQNLLNRISGLYEDGLFLRNLYEFIDYKVISKEHKQDTLFPTKINDGIILENVSFKYPNSSRYVFKELNLKVNKGETVAVVGANGAGKSTLVKLICGLYHADKGRVLIDDVEVKKITTESLANNVSVVFQDFMLYNVTAKENIWFGDISRSIEDPEIINSAKESGVHSIIQNLHSGYDTTLGTLFKDSEMLSVGEWQRIALSRSFFNNAQLVILDEPTSSMDALTEAKLIENFRAITKERTAIIVSHRLSTIQMADRIIVLGNHGKEEEGSFDKLIEKKGVFFKMYTALQRNGRES